MSRQKFWRQIRLPCKAGEANLLDKTYGQELSHFPNAKHAIPSPEGEGIACFALGNIDLGLSSYDLLRNSVKELWQSIAVRHMDKNYPAHIHTLRLRLIGPEHFYEPAAPDAPLGAHEMLSEPPQCRYPLGLLTSTEARVKPHAAANFVSSYPELAHTQAFDDAPDYTAPTSLGLNVRLRRSVAALDVEVYWGDYEQEAGDCYRRIPRSAMLCIPIPAPGVPIDVPDSGGLQLTVRMRGEFVDVFLINRRAAQPNAPQRSCAFQVTLVLRCAEGFAPHAPHASQPNTFAIGHGIAPAQQLDADGVCREVRSDWTPTAPLESAPPTALGELSMDVLGALADGAAAAAALAPLAVLAGDDAQRVEEGIALLHDQQILSAFCITSRALAAAARQRKASATWHPFQLTFLLLTLRGLCDPAHVDRERADLFFRLDDDERLNAHLGPAAFAMVLRRLRKPGRDGGGVSVLLRAARHALTPDLLSRATGIICALEHERARAPQQMGEWPFEIGLWVEHTSASVRIGRAGEKHIDAEHSAYARMMRFKQDDQRNPAPIPLQACPWCGTKFGGHSPCGQTTAIRSKCACAAPIRTATSAASTACRCTPSMNPSTGGYRRF